MKEKNHENKNFHSRKKYNKTKNTKHKEVEGKRKYRKVFKMHVCTY